MGSSSWARPPGETSAEAESSVNTTCLVKEAHRGKHRTQHPCAISGKSDPVSLKPEGVKREIYGTRTASDLRSVVENSSPCLIKRPDDIRTRPPLERVILTTRDDHVIPRVRRRQLPVGIYHSTLTHATWHACAARPHHMQYTLTRRHMSTRQRRWSTCGLATPLGSGRRACPLPPSPPSSVVAHVFVAQTEVRHLEDKLLAW